MFSSIIRSSIWRESKETRLVWITLLAIKDKYGCVRSSMWALARDAGVSEEECREAIRVLEGPDPDSATRDNDGRRIQPMEGGWLILNHQLWQDRINKAKRLQQQAAWQREYRKREKKAVHTAACNGAKAALADGFKRQAKGEL